MALTVIKDSNSIASAVIGGTGVTLNAGDTAFVLDGGSIIEAGNNSIGIEVVGDGATVKIDGLVYATGEAIDSFAQDLTVTVNGEVISDLYAMYLGGNGNHVTIGTNGQVEGSLVLTGDFSDLHNNGLISADGGRTAVYLGASGIWNTGTISAQSEAIRFQGTSTGSVNNSGTIIGSLNEFAPISPTAALNIDNSGLWKGDLTLTETADWAVNTGTITGSVYMHDGNDIYDGSNGHLYGTIDGGAGNDSIKAGSENNTIAGGAGADTLDGGGGVNTVDYSTSTIGVNVDLLLGTARHGDAAGDKLSHFQNITGTQLNDKLTGDGGDNVLSGVLGKDALNGGDGNDTLIELGAANGATLNGGNGNDSIQLLSIAQAIYGAAFSNSMKIDGGAGYDTLEISGDFASGVNLKPTTITNIEQLTLDAGFSYKLTMDDGNVGVGQTLNVDASQLDSAHILTFNGAAETNGRFVIEGGDGKDVIAGGTGDDVIDGGMSADTITGGLGHDTFVYDSGAESTSKNYDLINGFDANSDTFQLSVSVANIDAAVTNVSLSTSGFDGLMKTALTGHLLAGDAILVSANAGTLSGHTFLVVDANGSAGYQSGDYVFDVTGMSGTLTTSDFT